MTEQRLAVQVASVMRGDWFATDDGYRHTIAEAVILVIADDGTETRLPLYRRFGTWWTVR